jgi:hypothetical protein
LVFTRNAVSRLSIVSGSVVWELFEQLYFATFRTALINLVVEFAPANRAAFLGVKKG